MNFSNVITISVILFSVIDIIGNLPVIIDMKKQGMKINAGIATFTAALIMLSFLFFGSSILGLLGLEVASFALAGSFVIFLIGLEMLMGIRIFRDHHDDGGSGSIVPIAFPLLAGAGTLTTIISLKAEFDQLSIGLGIIVNLLIIYTILYSSDWLSNKIPAQVMTTLRKVFGIILLAIAIQMFRSNI